MTDDEILDRMSRHATRVAHTFIPAQEVEDAVQTAMLQVWRRLPKLDPARSPWPLLTLVVRQELAMFARALYERPEIPSEQPLPATLTASDPFRAPKGQPEFSARTRAFLDKVPAKDRKALIECVAEGRTRQQAAAILGVSDVMVGRRVKRALPALREAMAA